MKEKFDKSKIKETLLGSTAHGIPNLVRNESKFLKVLWIVCFFISLSGCTYFLHNAIIDYFNYKKVTKIDVIYEQPTDFPTISICNNIESNLTLENVNHCKINYDMSCLTAKENFFEPFSDTHYGRCLSFNSGKNFSRKPVSILKSYYPGSDDGLYLNFKINSTKNFNKLIIRIHNSSYTPSNMDNEDFKISPGKTYYIKIEKTIYQKLGEPYNQCLKDPFEFKSNQTIIRHMTKSGRSYSQAECYELCMNLKYFETNPCNCTFVSWDRAFVKCFSNNDLNSSLFKCTEEYRRQFSKNLFTNSDNGSCQDYCPLECDSISYSFSSFLLEYPLYGNITQNDRNKYVFSNFETYEDVQKSYYSMAIFYKDMKYTLISEDENYVLADLVSNIGGILGVFIGISFLSFIEIIELLYYCFNKKNIYNA